MYKILRFFKKITKILQYIPLLWQDEDWDYEYVLLLLKNKLNRIKKCISRNKIITPESCRDISIQINQVIDHIDGYLNAQEKYEKYYEKPPIEEIYHSIIDNKLVQINKKTNLPLTDKEEDEYFEHITHIYEFESKEWDLIWDTIKKYGRAWWD